MRLLVSCIPYDGGKSGISVYIREVVHALAEQGHELTLLEEEACLAAGGSKAAGCGEPGGMRGIVAPRWARRPAISMLWHLFVLPFWIWRHRREFDGFVICAANRRVCAWYPLPTAATVHDLANFHVPGKYSRLRMFYLARILPFFAKRSDYLVAVSEATKSDMVKFWGVSPNRVSVLYNGLPPALEQLAGSENHRLPNGSAILYISRIEHPGKNHLRLIEAYSRLPAEMAAKHPLILAGADWKDAEIVHEAASRSPHSGKIIFKGFVPDDELETLWGQAGYYVFPSLFEGFGLSLAEAMARGIPCACSNNGSLGEIGGDAAITFDPTDVGGIAQALRNLLAGTATEHAERIARGRARCAMFSWTKHAAGIARLLNEGRCIK